VLETSKHATHQLPKVEPGDLVLIAITKTTLPKGEKSIQQIGRFVQLHRDVRGESGEIWKKHWKYIIELEDVHDVEPFNLEEVQRTMHPYGTVRTHCALLPEDEQAVEEWLRQPGLPKVADRPDS